MIARTVARLLVVCLLKLFAIAGYGQDIQSITVAFSPPGQEQEYMLALNYQYRWEADRRARLTISNYDVFGGTQQVANTISVQIELPPALSGITVFLNSRLREGQSAVFGTDLLGQNPIEAQLRIFSAGSQINQKTIYFDPPTVLPAPLAPSIVSETLEDTTKVSPTKAIAPTADSPVILTPNPALPAHELDYRNLSAEAFIKKWPEQTDLVDRALTRIPLQPQVEQISTNVFELTFDYTQALRIDSVVGGDAYTLRSNEPLADYGHRMVIAVSDTGSYRLYLSDTTKLEQSVMVNLGNLLGGTFTQDEEAVTFRLSGGHPPYRLLFLYDGVPLADREIGSDTVRRITHEELRELTGTAGTFGVRLTDDQRSATWNFGHSPLVVAKDEPEPVTRYGPYALTACLLLLFAALFVRHRRRKQRRETVRANLQSAAGSHEPTNGEATTKRPAIVSSRRATARTRPGPHKSLGSKLRITRRHHRAHTTASFNPDERPTEFIALNLNEHWAASAIRTILFEHEAIRELDIFLHRENVSKVGVRQPTSKADWESNQPIPEIGGMLMGQYAKKDGSDYYRVSVEKFVPLKARVQNVVKVEIDPLSLARDLSLAQDENADLTVVGWFHTHPGHGLFLSQPDLKVQYGHFRSPYNFAMEIDPLTEGLDTAFFTYRPDGSMNNQRTRIQGTEWFSWDEIAYFGHYHTTS